jgi:hypothetical protein
MSLVTSFAVLLQPFALVMTTPSFENLVTILAGWAFAPRRTVTSMLQAAGAVGSKHHSAFHRLFASAVWSRDQMGLLVFDMLAAWLGNATVMLALDDTLARKRGQKMFGVGMHHDPLLSSRSKAITNWGHSWVVLGVIVRFPLWPERAFCLPILFRLYLNKDAAVRHRRVYRTRPELAVEMLATLCQARKSRHFHVIADSAYGGQSVLNHLPKNCHLTSRLLLNARLYGPRPQRKPGTNGRPRKRGPQLPTPAAMLAERATRMELKLYGRRDRVRLCDCVGHVYAAPERPLRVVAVEALSGGRGQQAFYSTAWEAAAVDILSWYAWRWSIEVAFHDSKQSLGFEEPQGWTRQAVERTAPTAMLLYSLIVVWFVRDGHRSYRSLERPWYTTKSQPSFADMLATLRRVSLREQVLSWGLEGPGSRKVLELLETTAALAA